MKYYLVGIKGSGMSALALYLKHENNMVRGWDIDKYFFTVDNLKNNNIIIDDYNNLMIDKKYIYIIGNAFIQNMKIIKRLNDLNIKYYTYQQFIKNIKKELFSVSGTHGKTTTSWFLVSLLNHETSYIIGDGSGKYYDNNYLVLETCEYKDHFLNYYPKISIINNIDLDHVDYFKNIQALIRSFNQFVKQSDLALINGDDLNCKKLIGNNIIKIGQNLNNDIIFNYTYDNDNTLLNIKYAGDIYMYNINFQGEHLIYNLVMAISLCLIIGKTPNVNNLTFPKRRMEEINYGKTIIINDYAHHPTEIKSLYNYIKLKYPNYYINVIFQPHTYTRTLKLKKEFKKSLSLFDNVYIDKVFTSSREEKNIYNDLKIKKYFKEFKKFNKYILNKIDKEKTEIWIFLGAGDNDKYIRNFIDNENN